MQEPLDHDEALDSRGLRCPLPVLKARKRLSGMTPGAVLLLLADDPASVVDVPFFCTEQGHDLVSSDTEDGVFRFRIRKGGAARATV